MIGTFLIGAGIAAMLIGGAHQVRLASQIRHSVQLLRRGDTTGFLTITDRLLEQESHPRVTSLLRLNRTAGLIYRGQWEEAHGTLLELDPKKLANRIEKTVYQNNLLFALLLMKKFPEARATYLKHRDLLLPETKNRDLNLALLGTLATYRYFFDTDEASRRLFERLLSTSRAAVSEAVSHYFLGRLELKQNRDQKAWEHFNKAIELAPDTYLPAEIQALAEKRPTRVGAPGEGQAC